MIRWRVICDGGAKPSATKLLRHRTDHRRSSAEGV